MNRLPVNINNGDGRRNHGDEYETHKFDIKYLLDTYAASNDVVWDPFVGSGYSQQCIQALGYATVATSDDFFALDAPPAGTTLIFTNPPFSKKVEVLRCLVKWDVPFIIILPSIVLQRDYFSDIVKGSKRRWWVELPNKSLFFHHDGEKQNLPAFKCCFVYSHSSSTRASLSGVDVKLIDYADIREKAGFKSNDIKLNDE